MKPPIFFRAHTIAAGVFPPLFLFLLLLASSNLPAQALRYDQPLYSHAESKSDSLAKFQRLTLPTESSPTPFLTQAFLPEYARENPSGYSYLCRMELKLEDQLPLGIWVRADEKGYPGGSLYLRLKMIRF